MTDKAEETIITKRHPVNEMPSELESNQWETWRNERIAPGLRSIHLFDSEENKLHCYLIETDQQRSGEPVRKVFQRIHI